MSLLSNLVQFLKIGKKKSEPLKVPSYRRYVRVDRVEELKKSGWVVIDSDNKHYDLVLMEKQ